jgi:FtsP/CotA-like multicopper oxidase with cupredoxin domain
MSPNTVSPEGESTESRGLNRRTVLKTGVLLGAVGTLPLTASPVAAVNLTSHEDFLLENAGWQSVPIANAIPAVMEADGRRRGATYYKVELQDGTHDHFPFNGSFSPAPTPIFGYEGQFPGKTIEARVNQRLAVEFVNELPNQHVLGPIDTRVHGTKWEDYDATWVEANEEEFGTFPETRAVTHTHGLHVESASDGLPEQWTSSSLDGAEVLTGPQHQKAVFDYTNRQNEATLWYHDHALGITRLNVYAGLAGFYLLRGPNEERLGLPSGDQEVPILFQDRSFNEDGSYDYPTDFEAEVSADVSVVNGLAWPRFQVEPRQYRFRMLNGSNGRFFNLRLETDGNNGNGDGVPTIYQIGAELGFLRDVVSIGPDEEMDMESLLLAPAERADVIVDFSEYAGETFTVTNDADFPFENPTDSTGTDGAGLSELAQFEVLDETPADPVVDPTRLRLPGPERFEEAAAVETRQMTLTSPESDPSGLDTHLLNDKHWNDPIETRPQLGTTEVWELQNETPDAHPIHLHLVDFQVIGRGPDGTEPPEPNETGNKDTVKVYNGETVRIISRFGNFAGRYVWHCHILEHEDQEMMRPYEVVTRRDV